MLIPCCCIQAKLYFKELLGEIFVISIIIKVQVRVISRAEGRAVMTLTEDLDYQKSQKIEFY